MNTCTFLYPTLTVHVFQLVYRPPISIHLPLKPSRASKMGCDYTFPFVAVEQWWDQRTLHAHFSSPCAPLARRTLDTCSHVVLHLIRSCGNRLALAFARYRLTLVQADHVNYMLSVPIFKSYVCLYGVHDCMCTCVRAPWTLSHKPLLVGTNTCTRTYPALNHAIAQ